MWFFEYFFEQWLHVVLLNQSGEQVPVDGAITSPRSD